ncbi:DUF6985 domain-containing protein [Bremerella cremea]|uniref:DUF6985 domain-containing protein n=1 Tax=Bremerella cremea TaxID=1031537 RepID=UPI0031E5A5F7
MNIEPLGSIYRDDDIEEWFESEPISIPFLDGRQLTFILENVEEDGRLEEFSSAVTKFLALTVQDRDSVTPYVFRYYSNYVAAVGTDELEIKIENPAHVWRHVQLFQIHVSRRPFGDASVHIQICGNCDWDREHGIQIVFREGNVLRRVSMQDGHLTYCDAFNVPESEDRIVQ